MRRVDVTTPRTRGGMATTRLTEPSIELTEERVAS
jgi:hypothetical protein